LPTAASTKCVAGELDVLAFGVVGDGKVDDAPGLQQAINSGTAAIRLPKGTYRITRPLVVDLDRRGYFSIRGDGVANLVMDGPGPALRVVGTHVKSADPENFESRVWDRQRMPLIDGLAIVGNHAEANGIEASGTMQLTITRVHIRRVLHGVVLSGNNRNVILSNCHIYENRGVGVYYDQVNLHQSNITACHISYNAGGGIVTRAGNVRNIHISGCDIESNMSLATPPTANVLIDCTGSTTGTGEVAISGCTIQHNNPSPESANIRILGGSRPSGKLKTVREGHVTITGNVLSDVQCNVHLQDCRGVTLVGNTFWLGYTHDVLIERCNSIVIGSNNFDRNPRYDYGNTTQSNGGLVIRDSEDCNLTGLHVTGVWRAPAGLLIENSRRFVVANCTVLDCDQRGMLLRNVRDSLISGCIIRDDRPQATSVALEIEGGSGNLVRGNMLANKPRASDGAALLHDNIFP
jgi:hypothetical protein